MEYSIKDLENLSNIKAHTIRIWEKRYGIIKPERTQTNIRYYNDDQLRKLLNISILINNGIKISHIAAYSNDEIKEKALFILQNPNDMENQVKNLVIAMIELSETKFERILTKFIFNNGFEKTMLNLIYPFLNQIGVLWQTGSINPAQEHFISSLIRQKLISSIDSIEFRETSNTKRFVLFLPEGEWHELGLLFYYYLLKMRGHLVLYLGQSTPLNSITESLEIWPADYLLLSASSNFSGIPYQHYLTELASQFKSQRIIVAGQLLQGISNEFPSKIEYVSNAVQFIQIIDNLN